MSCDGCAPAPYCGRLFKRVTVPIATFDNDSGMPSVASDVVLWLVNPSPLLSCLVAIVLQQEQAVSNQITFNNDAVWQLYPALPAFAPLLGPQALQPVFRNAVGVGTPRDLPDGYTIADPTKLIKIVASIGADSSDEFGQGTAYAVATWEPLDPRMPRDLWLDLAGEAALALDGGARRLVAV